MPSHHLSCPTCLRRESTDGTVLQPGGGRAPDEHPTLAAWRVVRRSQRGELGPVVGACPACGLPWVSDDPAAVAITWTLELPDRQVVLDDSVDAEALEQELEASFAEPIAWASTMFSGVAGLAVLIPILLWVFAIIVVSGIFYEAFKVNFMGQPVTPFD